MGAQFGGKYYVHDVRVIRAPRHAASCPVAIGVSCSADRNIKAKITPEGIFVEKLEKNPARFLPAQAPAMSPAVDIDLDEGMDKVREILSQYPIKTRLNLKGTLVVARDIAHARIKQMLDEGKLGFKSGEGFQSWTPEQIAESNAALNEYLVKMLKN